MLLNGPFTECPLIGAALEPVRCPSSEVCTHTSPWEISIRIGKGINSNSRNSTKVSLSSIAQKFSHYAWAISESNTWEQPMSYDPLQNVSFCTNHPQQPLSRPQSSWHSLWSGVMSKGSTALGSLQWFYYPCDSCYSLLFALSTSILSIPILSWTSSAWSSPTSARFRILSLPSSQCHELLVPLASVTITIVSKWELDPPRSPAAWELTEWQEPVTTDKPWNVAFLYEVSLQLVSVSLQLEMRLCVVSAK